MKVHQPGVLAQSDLYFHTPSVTAAELFFYPVCTGHYFCDERYLVRRQSYDSFLIVYVAAGSGFVESGGQQYLLSKGDFAFLDCYQPHCYGTRQGWEIYWVHFDGGNVRRYHELCTQQTLILSPSNVYTGESTLRKIFEMFHDQQRCNEALLSKRLTDLLTELLLCAAAAEQQEQQRAGAIEDILAYIAEHVNSSLSLEKLARRAMLSPFYFSRIFKQETGFTPHAYIIQARISLARFLLKTTGQTVKQVGLQSGFNSECGFCTTFKRITGKTPTDYRTEGRE